MTRAPVLIWHFLQFARPGRQKSEPCALAIEPRQGALSGAQDHLADGRRVNVRGLAANRAQSSPGKGRYPAPKIMAAAAASGALAGWWPTARSQVPARGLTRPQDHPGDGRPDDGCGLVANCAPLSPRVGPYPAPKIIPLMVARAAHAGRWPTARSCVPARGLIRPQDHRGVRRRAAARGLGADRVSLSPGGTFDGPLILVRPTGGDC